MARHRSQIDESATVAKSTGANPLGASLSTLANDPATADINGARTRWNVRPHSSFRARFTWPVTRPRVSAFVSSHGTTCSKM